MIIGPGPNSGGPDNDLMNYDTPMQSKWSPCSNEDFRNYYIEVVSEEETFCLKTAGKSTISTSSTSLTMTKTLTTASISSTTTTVTTTSTITPANSMSITCSNHKNDCQSCLTLDHCTFAIYDDSETRCVDKSITMKELFNLIPGTTFDKLIINTNELCLEKSSTTTFEMGLLCMQHSQICTA